jgi:hypothetical protein
VWGGVLEGPFVSEDVRSTLNNRHHAQGLRCRLSAKGRHSSAATKSLQKGKEATFARPDNEIEWLSRSFRGPALLVGPFPEIGGLGGSLDGRHISAAGDQDRARDIALPGRIDFVSKPFGKTVIEHPVLGRR